MAPFGLGFLCAFVALILCVVFGATNGVGFIVALLVGLVALSRLLT